MASGSLLFPKINPQHPSARIDMRRKEPGGDVVDCSCLGRSRRVQFFMDSPKKVAESVV